MTEHADTIRRTLMVIAPRGMTGDEGHAALMALDALLAERQQLQDKLWEQSEAAANLITEVERLEAERQQAQQERDGNEKLLKAHWQECDRLRVQRRQAIDALRRAKTDIGVIGREQRSWQQALIVESASKRIDAALVKLGENPLSQNLSLKTLPSRDI